jgi:hypothetical protein
MALKSEEVVRVPSPMGGMKIVAFTLFIGALVGCVQSASAGGDVERGRLVAQKHCSRCHVIGEFNKYGGIGSTPSFQMLVNYMDDYRERFETFYVRNPHPSLIAIEGLEITVESTPHGTEPIKLPQQAVKDILVFVETLRKN